MDTLPFLVIAGAAVGGALAGAGGTYWPMARVITELRERLARSEQARNGAVDRSTQAREQIAQLNRAITELRRTHAAPASLPAISPREQVEKSLAEGDDTMMLPRREGAQAFADTQIMANSR